MISVTFFYDPWRKGVIEFWTFLKIAHSCRNLLCKMDFLCHFLSENVYLNYLSITLGGGEYTLSPKYWYTIIGQYYTIFTFPYYSLLNDKERKYHISRQYWYTRNVLVFTYTGMLQYLGPEVYFFCYSQRHNTKQYLTYYLKAGHMDHGCRFSPFTFQCSCLTKTTNQLTKPLTLVNQWSLAKMWCAHLKMHAYLEHPVYTCSCTYITCCLHIFTNQLI